MATFGGCTYLTLPLTISTPLFTSSSSAIPPTVEGKVQTVEVETEINVVGLTAAEFNTEANKAKFADAMKVRPEPRIIKLDVCIVERHPDRTVVIKRFSKG